MDSDATTPALKISVITVCYNAASTIGDALKSVASQSWPSVEHIVIDGASSDGTLDVVRAHASGLARVVSEPDRGIYDAMNKGLRLATGDIVGFLNADDVLAGSDVLRQIALTFQGRPDVDAVYGDLRYVDRGDTNRVFRHWRSEVFEPGALRFGWMPPHPTLYIRRARLAEIGEFNATLKISADYDFIVRLFKRPGRTYAYLDRVLVLMRVGGASNRSLKAILRKSREDLGVMRRHRIGGISTLIFKNFRKIGQLFVHR